MISENKGVKYGHIKGTCCFYKYVNKKETEAAPVSDRGAVLCIAQRQSHNVPEREIQMFKMT